MFQSISFAITSYLVRPSPFSAQKTFERHNSRRKSNISFCSNINMAQAAAAAAGSRRGSGFNINTLQGVTPMAGYGSQRAPFVTTKSNSLSLPDSPASVVGQTRARSNSLRVIIAHTIFNATYNMYLYWIFLLVDWQWYTVATIELVATGSTKCGRIRSPEVIIGRNWHKSFYDTYAGQ